MQVFFLIVAFSLQTDVSGQVVLIKGKHLKIKTSYSRQLFPAVYLLMPLRFFMERREITTF